jgi:hypothetical protein
VLLSVLDVSIGSWKRKGKSSIGNFSFLRISFAGLHFSKCALREEENVTAAGGRFAATKRIYVLCKSEKGYLSDNLFGKILRKVNSYLFNSLSYESLLLYCINLIFKVSAFEQRKVRLIAMKSFSIMTAPERRFLLTIARIHFITRKVKIVFTRSTTLGSLL